jgi:hypothetical protein
MHNATIYITVCVNYTRKFEIEEILLVTINMQLGNLTIVMIFEVTFVIVIS